MEERIKIVDKKVLNMPYVIGAGGTPYIGIKFDPVLLKERLGYIVADITDPKI
jgi:prolyl-tRNA editing enzyme YbaK/EbsC (Cys-tRNA(Pro) deacylase)